MRFASSKIPALLLAALLCASVLSARAVQEKASSMADSPAEASPDPNKAKLLDATRVDTEKAARSAAKAAAKPATEKTETPKDPDKESPEVTELTPASKAKSDETVLVLDEKTGSSPLNKIHGSVYGSDGAGTSQTGASVGASSKSGKTSIYVESERSRSDPSNPH
jgi:hypothetical protein